MSLIIGNLSKLVDVMSIFCKKNKQSNYVVAYKTTENRLTGLVLVNSMGNDSKQYYCASINLTSFDFSTIIFLILGIVNKLT